MIPTEELTWLRAVIGSGTRLEQIEPTSRIGAGDTTDMQRIAVLDRVAPAMLAVIEAAMGLSVQGQETARGTLIYWMMRPSSYKKLTDALDAVCSAVREEMNRC